MAKAATTCKNNWNAKNYDRLQLMLKAGEGAKLKAAAAEDGISVNKLVLRIINGDRPPMPGLLTVLNDAPRRKKAEPDTDSPAE